VLDQFREITVVDFEFEAHPGERPVPVCEVAHELRSGRRFRIFQDQLLGSTAPPYATGPDTLLIGYNAAAEFGCYLQLDWSMPKLILDLYVEFKNRTNGLPVPAGRSLLGALSYFGLDGMGATEKKEIQQAIGNGTWRGRYTPTEILDYCQSDVFATERLLQAMLPKIDLPRALLRGRFMPATAAMQHAGVPVDVEKLELLRENWEPLKDQLIAEVDKDYNVYEGRSFKHARFEALLIRLGIPWPRTETGRLATDDETFRQMSRIYPVIASLRELRHTLSDLRLNDLTVGTDWRNRTILWAFQSKTGRTQPSNTEYIFGPSRWLRGLIKPPPGHGVAYIDWSQQEFGIAAALSGDPAMLAAYLSGDCYLAFAKQAGAVPADATKDSHPVQRGLFKQCVLAVQYGMGVEGLADRIGQPTVVARDLLRAHRETYKQFWEWSDAAVDHAMLHGFLPTVFGWNVHVGENPNPRSLRNYVMQGNGAEMYRLACCLGIERGVEICAPVHDATMICAPLGRLDADIATMRAAMAEASRIVLGGFELRTDVAITRYPDRYMDEDGAAMWDRVMRLLGGPVRQTA
jgi:DNA polymerase-1